MSGRREKVTISLSTLADEAKPDGTDFYVFDKELSGFGVRVRASGARSYFVQYRAGSGRAAPDRRVTIAKVGQITPKQARDRAKQLLADVVMGGDPAMAKTADRSALTFKALSDLFIAHVKVKLKPSTALSYEQLLGKHVLPKLGKRKAQSITSDDIEELHSAMDATPMAANRVRAIISSMYGWATSGTKRKLPAQTPNPAKGVLKFKESGRDRFLTADELTRIGAAIQEAETVGIAWEPDPAKRAKHAKKEDNRRVKMHPSAATALRLLLLTGCRLREILHLRWSEVDFDRGQLFLGDSKTGRKIVTLNAPALAVLAATPRVGLYVIAGDSAGANDERPRSDLKRPWAAVTARAGLDGLRLHDLRHTFASVGVRDGLSLHIVGRLLGHSQQATTQRYAHLDADPLRKASNTIGSQIAAALGEPQSSAEIIPMKRKGS